MIRSQRRAHFVVWRVLAPLTLIGLIIAIAVRPARPQGAEAGGGAPAMPGSPP